MSRPSTARLTTLVIALTLASLALAAPVAAAPACTTAAGQAYIDDGRYDRAAREFECVIESDPASVDGHRGRMEALVLLGRYSDAVLVGVRFNAVVVPAHPDAERTIVAGYASRLAAAPSDVVTLTGATFARWWFFDYPAAIHLASRLLDVRPDDRVGSLFRGSSRLLHHVQTPRGIADLDRAIALDPDNPGVHFIVSDAYTYGLPDPDRALAEATLALDGGLDTPRVHALLGAAYNALGETLTAASHIKRHLDLVTTELLPAPALLPGDGLSLDFVPGRTYEIEVPAVAGQAIVIATGSHAYWDSIAVLLAPDGSPVIGSDDDSGYFAAFDWVAEQTVTYRLRVSFFDSVATGLLAVSRD